MSDGYVCILGNKKRFFTSIILRIFLKILSYCKEKSFDITTNANPFKNRIEWLKDKRPSDIINSRCLLPKTDFIIFYFELETLLNQVVKLCSSFFQKNNFEQKCRVFYFHQKSQLIF